MKVAIIGAGASGLMLANYLKLNNVSFTLFNKGNPGRKILASGNGRCNITNRNIAKEYYHNNDFIFDIVNSNYNNMLDMLNKLKIYIKNDNEGRCYPISESSLSVLNALLKNISYVDEEIISIKKNNGYYVNSYGPFDYVVYAIGSPAGIKNYNKSNLLPNNVKINEFKPSLVGFKIKENIKSISGVRAKALISLYNNNIKVYEENGEIIFKDDGISGICIMNASSYYNHLNDKKNSYIALDFIPNSDYDDLSTVLNPKLLDYKYKHDFDVHNMILNIKDTYSMEFAQVANGGVDLSELNPNLSLKADKNLYVIGEYMDSDAICGGYNLTFAFTSALRCGGSILDEIRNK